MRPRIARPAPRPAPQPPTAPTRRPNASQPLVTFGTPPSSGAYRERVGSILATQRRAIDSCRDRFAADREGLLFASITIGTSGRVLDARTQGFEERPEFGACVVQRLRGLVFPAPTEAPYAHAYQWQFPQNPPAY